MSYGCIVIYDLCTGGVRGGGGVTGLIGWRTKAGKGQASFVSVHWGPPRLMIKFKLEGFVIVIIFHRLGTNGSL